MKKILLLTLLAAMAAGSWAEVTFNGFASVVMGVDLEDDGNPTNDYDGRVDSLQESKVALQWTADLEDGMRFVGQAMARGDSAEGYVLNYDWAYFDINVGDSGKFKVGRLRIPFYKYSDYLDVGYAYHWVTPPKSMYSLSFSNADGISYQQNFVSGSLEHSINAMYGRYQGNLQLGGNPVPGILNNLIAINWSGNIGNHEFYAAYAQAKVTLDTGTLLTGIEALAADSEDVVLADDPGSFVGVGYKGGFGDVNVFAEYSIVKVEDALSGEGKGGYLGASYVMGDYTYHLTYGFEEDIANTITAATGLQPTLDAIRKNAGNRGSEGESNTITLGVRKDVGASSAFKVDLSSYTEDRFQGSFAAPAATKSEQTALLLRVALETMF